MNSSAPDTERRVLLLLALAGFLSLVSTRLCDAMLPALAKNFAVSTAEAASAISSYAIAYGTMQLVYGPLGDRFGKPRIIAWATALCAACTTLAALAPSMATLVAARAAMGATAAAVIPLSLAWIGDTVPLERRQQALAKYSGTTVFGLVVGPLVGGIFAQALSWRAAFGVLAPILGVMAGALWFFLKSQRARPPRALIADALPRPYLQTITTLIRARWVQLVLLAVCIEAALGIGCLAFVPTVLRIRFGLPMMEGGAIVALFGLGGFLFSRSAAPMLRLMKPASLPGAAAGVLATAYVLLAVMPHWLWATLACPLAGFGFFMLHNTLQVQATQLSKEASGLALSLFTCSIFIGQSIGVAIGAVTFTSLPAYWSFGAASLGFMLLGLTLMHLVTSRPTEEPCRYPPQWRFQAPTRAVP